MKKSTLLIVAILIAIGGLIAYQERPLIYTSMNEYRLLPLPERLTELSFNNVAALPREITPGTPTTFSFTIHNLEGVTTAYPYNVYFESPDGTRDTFITGTISLDDGASRSVTIAHTFPATETKGKVVVLLTALDQQIDFLVPNTN